MSRIICMASYLLIVCILKIITNQIAHWNRTYYIKIKYNILTFLILPNIYLYWKVDAQKLINMKINKNKKYCCLDGLITFIKKISLNFSFSSFLKRTLL